MLDKGPRVDRCPLESIGDNEEDNLGLGATSIRLAQLTEGRAGRILWFARGGLPPSLVR